MAAQGCALNAVRSKASQGDASPTEAVNSSRLDAALSWRPDEEAAQRVQNTINKIDDGLSAVDRVNRQWAEFQAKFDAINRQLVARIGQAMEAAAPRDLTEYQDTPESIAAKARELAEAIKGAKNAMILTGAGISTSAGICDYRGPKGKWTLQAKGEKASCRACDTLVPTPCHMAIKALVDKGMVGRVVSTNVDGLHRYSGLALDKLVEVHGNVFTERCQDCDTLYERPFPVKAMKGCRRTGGACNACKGPLLQTIVNFGDKLRAEEWESVRVHAQDHCDLLIVLGTSVSVAPVMYLPSAVVDNAAGGKMCLVNKQKTPSDHLAKIHTHAGTDQFMAAVMEALGISIPQAPELRTQYGLVERLAWRKEHGCLFDGPLREGVTVQKKQTVVEEFDLGDTPALVAEASSARTPAPPKRGSGVKKPLKPVASPAAPAPWGVRPSLPKILSKDPRTRRSQSGSGRSPSVKRPRAAA
eukprot:Hpha_TRINITY_DN14466_c0_g1::TRINITY_DN14466_c0_g1_i1::g.157261::m.157261/K11416/SIRT6, SIR2L6; mono-ADP-ribosyltransferase sirtuin 6